MLNINRVMLTGRLTRDPETKYLPSGQAVTNLSVAVSRSYQDKNNEWKEETSFIDIETWGKLAERMAETARKGQPVYIEGRLKQESWERDGVKQSKIRVSADMVKAFEVPRGGQSDRSGGNDQEYSSDSAQFSSGQRSQGASEGSSKGRPSDDLDFRKTSGAADDMPF